MPISYTISGRFGNNLYQYFACKIISKLTNKKYEYIGNNLHEYNKTSFIISDSNFYEVYDKTIIISQDNILLSGFFQNIKHLTENLEYIRELFNINNEDRINNEHTIKDIVNYCLNIPQCLEYKNNKDTLFVHVRLDDFYHQGWNSEILDPIELKKYIINIVKEENKNNCVIIADKIRQDWEQKYIDELLKLNSEYKDNFIRLSSNSLLEDFSLIYNAEYIVLCRSTFGWISTLLSTINKKNWFPEHNIDKTRKVFNEKSIYFSPSYYTTKYL